LPSASIETRQFGGRWYYATILYGHVLTPPVGPDRALCAVILSSTVESPC